MHPPPPIPSQAGRPKSLVAAAIICFIFGAFGLFGLVGAIMTMVNFQPGILPEAKEAARAMINEPHIRGLAIYGGFLNAIGGAAAIAAGVGLLKCRNWARTVVILWSAYRFIMAPITCYVTIAYTVPMTQPMMMAQMKAQSGGKEVAGFETIMKASSIGSMIAAYAIVIFSIAISITLIILVTRPRAKAACKLAAQQ